MTHREWMSLFAGACIGAVASFVVSLRVAPSDARLHAALAARPDFVANHPDLLAATRAALQSQVLGSLGNERSELIRNKWAPLIDVAFAPSIGASASTRVLLEFTDYTCAPCKQSAPVVRRALMKDPDLRVSILLLPTGGAIAEFAARIAYAAYRQNPIHFGALHDLLMNEPKALTQGSILAMVKQAGFDLEEVQRDSDGPQIRRYLSQVKMFATDLHANGVPVFAFDRGLVTGGISGRQLGELIGNGARKAAAVTANRVSGAFAREPSTTRPFSLTDQSGNAVTADSFRGSWLLVYFGFTNCPDVCPITLAHMRDALRLLGPDAKNVRLVFVTVDPDRDSSAVLARYLSAFDMQIVGLTGTSDQISRAKTVFGAYAAKQAQPRDGSYTVEHSSSLYLIDPAGDLNRQFSADIEGAHLAASLKTIITGRS